MMKGDSGKTLEEETEGNQQQDWYCGGIHRDPRLEQLVAGEDQRSDSEDIIPCSLQAEDQHCTREAGGMKKEQGDEHEGDNEAGPLCFGVGGVDQPCDPPGVEY